MLSSDPSDSCFMAFAFSCQIELKGGQTPGAYSEDKLIGGLLAIPFHDKADLF